MKILTKEEIQERLKGLSGWTLTAQGIQKRFELNDFRSAILFLNRVADIAEEMNHHPDILINYDKVTFTIITHDAGGITRNDFELAARIDALAQ
jgi:4a-hydroxytetrahydrobiopterin dehydratase